MQRLIASIKKELLLLWNDKTGVLLLFLMPLLLVFIITIIQDSAYKIVNDNKIPMLIVNHDEGALGTELITQLEASGLFAIKADASLQKYDLEGELLSSGKLIALYLPNSFTESVAINAQEVSQIMMADLGLAESDTSVASNHATKMPDVTFYYDPVMQENYSFSVMNILRSYLTKVETGLVIDRLYQDLEVGDAQLLKEKMLHNQVGIQAQVAKRDATIQNPNSTQHNVPAWSLFAMFFMVISLGGNILKERANGSFIRLKTMPTSFVYVMTGKMVVFLLVAFVQITLAFLMGLYLLPELGLPKLNLPSNTLMLIAVVTISGLTAVSYAMLIGVFAKTLEQVNGFGAVSIIIFGAIGGIWIPYFVMPSFMQTLGFISPLRWCLEGFYILFLRGGSWIELAKPLSVLLLFILVCQGLIVYRLRKDKII